MQSEKYAVPPFLELTKHLPKNKNAIENLVSVSATYLVSRRMCNFEITENKLSTESLNKAKQNDELFGFRNQKEV